MDRALEWLRVALDDPTWQVSLALTVLLLALASCRVFSKAGFHGMAGLLMLVPGLNVVAFLALAFLPWPVRREARHLRRMQKAVHRADPEHHEKRVA